MIAKMFYYSVHCPRSFCCIFIWIILSFILLLLVCTWTLHSTLSILSGFSVWNVSLFFASSDFDWFSANWMSFCLSRPHFFPFYDFVYAINVYNSHTRIMNSGDFPVSEPLELNRRWNKNNNTPFCIDFSKKIWWTNSKDGTSRI